MPAEQTEDVRTYRTAEFRAMGFTWREAEQMAQASDHNGYVDIHAVRKALADGCSHRQALRIWA